MSLYANVNNSKKEVTGLFGNVNGAKKEIVSLWANKDGKPVQIFGSGAGNAPKWLQKNYCLFLYFGNTSSSIGVDVIVTNDCIHFYKLDLSAMPLPSGTTKVQSFSIQTVYEKDNEKFFYVSFKAYRPSVSLSTKQKYSCVVYRTTDFVNYTDITSNWFAEVYGDEYTKALASYGVLLARSKYFEVTPTVKLTLLAITTFYDGSSAMYAVNDLRKTNFDSGSLLTMSVLSNKDLYAPLNKSTQYQSGTAGRLNDVVSDTTSYFMPRTSYSDDNIHGSTSVEDIVYFTYFEGKYIVEKYRVPSNTATRAIVYVYDKDDFDYVLDDEHKVLFMTSDEAGFQALSINQSLGAYKYNDQTWYDEMCFKPGLSKGSHYYFVSTSGSNVIVLRINKSDKTHQSKTLNLSTSPLFEGLVFATLKAQVIENVTANVNNKAGMLLCVYSEDMRRIYYIPDADSLWGEEYSKWEKVYEESYTGTFSLVAHQVPCMAANFKSLMDGKEPIS